MNKKLFYLIIVFTTTFSFSCVATSKPLLDSILPETKDCNYFKDKLYQPFSGIDKTFPGAGSMMVEKNGVDCVSVASGTENILKVIFNIAITLIILLTIINISWSGIQFMTEEAVGKKGEAKKRLYNSLIALALGLSAYTIMFTINKQLVEFSFNPSEIDTKNQVGQGIKDANKNSGALLSYSIGAIEALVNPKATSSGYWVNPYGGLVPNSTASWVETMTNANFSTYASFGSIKCGPGTFCTSSNPTVFGYKDGDGTVGMTGDNGIGNAEWSTIPGCTADTGNTYTMGVALPKGFWGAAGIPTSEVKYVGIKLYVNGEFKKILPVVDNSQSNLDLTFAVAKAYIDPTITNSNRLNTSGKKVSFEIVKDYYKTNQKQNILYTSNQSTFSNKIPCNNL